MLLGDFVKALPRVIWEDLLLLLDRQAHIQGRSYLSSRLEAAQGLKWKQDSQKVASQVLSHTLRSRIP